MAEKAHTNVEKNLVIVESPAKAKTIARYLGRDYMVKASIGHIVDLPKQRLGVEIEKDFEPEYQILPEKKKVAQELKKAAQKASRIYLASDPDREGEAIAWHIANLIRDSQKPIKRVLINEITRQAVKKAIENAGELNQDRFEAQQARRILDRLVGYLISPLLWKKIQSGLSAGRVQSVAVRLICEREREIEKFKPEEYWTIDAKFQGKAPPEFSARLIEFNGKKIKISSQKQAEEIIEQLKGKVFQVAKVEKKERRRKPPEPFITARLQQEASRRLGFSAKKTMSIAQQLYEGVELGPEGRVGLITYMRTDSVRVSEQAISQVRKKIKEIYGEEYLPSKPNIYKSRKGAQEAHEAIRPTVMDYTPEKVKQYLTSDQFKLYQLIYQRFLASQMKPAVYDQTIIEITADGFLFKGTGSVLKFPGFLACWKEEDKAEEQGFPEVKPGEELSLLALEPKQHFTQPPPRYSEASLIRELEQKGIGRPSTYAQIVSTIQERGYVKKEKGVFRPTPLGYLVNEILIRSFPDLVNVKFTAQMENQLDRIEEGKLVWVDLLRSFFKEFSHQLEKAPKVIDEIKAEIPTDIPCPKCGKELVIRWGKKGEFLACSGFPACDFTANFQRGENGEIIPKFERETGLSCPECGKPLVIRQGEYGEFLGCSGYPKCRFTADFEKDEQGKIKIKPGEKSGIKCEKCGREMQIKKVGKREFLACSGYPECKNIKNFRRKENGEIEIVEKSSRTCPKCGKELKLKKGRYGLFFACSGYPECDYTQPFSRKGRKKNEP